MGKIASIIDICCLFIGATLCSAAVILYANLQAQITLLVNCTLVGIWLGAGFCGGIIGYQLANQMNKSRNQKSTTKTHRDDGPHNALRGYSGYLAPEDQFDDGLLEQDTEDEEGDDHPDEPSDDWYAAS